MCHLRKCFELNRVTSSAIIIYCICLVSLVASLLLFGSRFFFRARHRLSSRAHAKGSVQHLRGDLFLVSLLEQILAAPRLLMVRSFNRLPILSLITFLARFERVVILLVPLLGRMLPSPRQFISRRSRRFSMPSMTQSLAILSISNDKFVLQRHVPAIWAQIVVVLIISSIFPVIRVGFAFLPPSGKPRIFPFLPPFRQSLHVLFPSLCHPNMKHSG